MIFMFIGVAIVLIVLGCILLSHYWEFTGCTAIAIGGFILVVVIIAAITLGVEVSNLAVIDDKIAMYQEENAKIEAQIADVVQQYQQYESDIFTEITPESSITLVALYPELKSDTLVQSQIDVYIANNEQIKSLKEAKINGSVLRWWLYFGG